MTDPSSTILDRLSGLHPKRIDLSLGRIERLLDRLDRPQDRLPLVIHVAGTNGKGSTIAFLRAILEAAGARVHVYTSPHLVRFSERIVLAGHEIKDEALAALLEECEDANAGEPITFFEITTAAALLAFVRAPAEVTLLETGLGGRLDATNVVADPALTAITPISPDHQEFLGATLAEIAGEKAGILKPGVPCVLAAQPEEAFEVISRRAAEVGAPLLLEGLDWSVSAAEDGRSLRFRLMSKVRTPTFAQTVENEERAETATELALPTPGLAGAHQHQNAGMAVVCALMLAQRFAIDGRAIAKGLTAARWPARLQRLGEGALAALLPSGWELWLDGGHNPGAAAVLARQLAHWNDRPCHLVLGMLKTKDADAFVAALAAYVKSAVTVSIPGEAASLSAEEACTVVSRHGIPTRPAASIDAALRDLAERETASARVLICGSLYLAGAILAQNGGV